MQQGRIRPIKAQLNFSYGLATAPIGGQPPNTTSGAFYLINNPINGYVYANSSSNYARADLGFNSENVHPSGDDFAPTNLTMRALRRIN